jgi:tRNA(His) 5'-end guanylyltransferase
MYKDAIGDRMKQYENCYRVYMPKRSAVVVRIDGRAFHTFTKGFARPYDKLFASCMQETARKLCENVGGCRFGYTQSDEITLILADWENPKTEPWFGNNLQKIVSISASMATLFFNKSFEEAIKDEYTDWYTTGTVNDEKEKLLNQHTQAYNNKLCVFDARAFIVPREEIFNVLYWRQLDCKRNSIQLLGQAHFSHNQLQNKNSNEIQEMLFQEKNINWANEPEWFKNGVAIYKKPTKVEYHNEFDGSSGVVYRNKWYADLETPVFTKDKQYIEKYFI